MVWRLLRDPISIRLEALKGGDQGSDRQGAFGLREKPKWRSLRPKSMAVWGIWAWGDVGCGMRILVLFAHPLETSFVAALHRRIVETIRVRGHEVDDLDLYAERFDPVLSRQAYIDYLDTVANRAQVGAYVDRLLAAEALIVVSPIWHDGFPAILKGYFDRVFLPGVSFKIDQHGIFWPTLSNIKRLVVVCGYGADRQRTSRIGDPVRHFVTRSLAEIAPGARCEYIALYGMDAATPLRRTQYLKRVTRHFGAW
jgi:NAD(P)H dehydrogenase (quinone)